jgi:AhpD family alkylhydroperoxidase
VRLSPIERPRSPWMRLAFRISKQRFGKVLAALKVIYARKPRLLLVAQMIARTQEKGISLEPPLRLLVQVKVSQLNGCPFCEDLALAQALRKRLGPERFRHLSEYRTSGAFSKRERTALALAEEATRFRRVSDETWAAARENFSETEIVELVWLNAAENYFNLQAAVLGIESDQLAAPSMAAAHE